VDNDVIVRVHAAGFTPGELDWPGTWADRDRAPSVPGHELSGVVVELGYGTTGLTVGQRVFGLTDWCRNGTLAEYTAVEARNLAPLALWTFERLLRPLEEVVLWTGGAPRMVPEFYGSGYEPLETLSHVAAATERIKLGTAVLVAPVHVPVVLAAGSPPWTGSAAAGSSRDWDRAGSSTSSRRRTCRAAARARARRSSSRRCARCGARTRSGTTSRSSCAEDAIGIRPSAIRPARLTAAGVFAASSTGMRG